MPAAGGGGKPAASQVRCVRALALASRRSRWHVRPLGRGREGGNMTTRAKAIITTGVVVPIVAAVLAAVAGGVAGKAYDSLLAWLAPDHVSGFYVMLDANNGPTETGNPLLEDGLTLQSHGGVISGVGQHGDKQWICRGYLKNGYIVLAYRATTADGLGFGTYVLADQDGSGQVYTGHFEGNVCPERRLFRCNAVLVKGAVGTRPNTAEAYKPLLSAQCVVISGFGDTSPHPCGPETATRKAP
jgi:hypothetical protein